MPRDGTNTRTAIMDAAEALILQQGFAATSVDRVIERAGVTKGGFFYHFKTKNDLAHAIVERYATLDAQHLHRNLARAAALSADPLDRALIFIGLFRDEAAELAGPSPGCLFASYIYEAQLFDAHTLDTIQGAMLEWRRAWGGALDAVLKSRKPRFAVRADSLADMMICLMEGAFIMSRTLKDPKIAAEQLVHYRNYLELLFEPKG